MPPRQSHLEQYLVRAVKQHGDYGWGRILIALLLLAVGCGLVVAIIGWVLALTGTEGGTEPPPVTVLKLAAIALWVPVVLLVARTMFGMSLADLMSWVPGIRWRLLGMATVISLVGLSIYMVGVVLVKKTPLVPITGGVIVAVLLAIVLVPFQALAEELLFRALGPQMIIGKIGYSLVKYVVVAMIASAIFASLHGAGDVITWLVFYSFGLVFAWLVYVTGGLEAALALHAVNNVLLIVSGVLTGRNLKAVQTNASVDLAVVVQVLVVVVIAAVITFAFRTSSLSP